MSLYTSNNDALCPVFPTSLKGGALSWFTRILLNSIDYFEIFMSIFVNQFAISRPHHLTSIALVNIQNRRRENLLGRSWRVTLNIQNLNLDVALDHMVMALGPGPFANSLYKKSTLNLDEL